MSAEACVPPNYVSDEAHQFDWSHEIVLIAGVELSRICAAPSARLGHLAFEGQGAFASQC